MAGKLRCSTRERRKNRLSSWAERGSMGGVEGPPTSVGLRAEQTRPRAKFPNSARHLTNTTAIGVSNTY